MPPKLHTGFLSHDRQDQHKTLSYNDRFLDSMAGILETIEPCAAVASNNNEHRFLLSHNRNLTTGEESIIKKKQELINASNPDKAMILGMYLIYSYSFGKVLEYYRDKFTEVNTENASILGTLLESIGRTRDKFDKYVVESNSVEMRAKRAADDIKKIRLAPDIPSLDRWKKQAETYLHSATQDIESIIEFRQHSDQYIKEVSKQYIAFLNSADLTSAHVDLIRPLQDIEKALHHVVCMRRENAQYSINIEVMKNERKVHSEVNIAAEFPNLAQKYIGVSILCCGACHETLNQYQYIHRGTHGICDDWVAPVLQFDSLVESLYSKYKQKEILHAEDLASEDIPDDLFSGMFDSSTPISSPGEEIAEINNEEELHERLHNRGRSLSLDEFENQLPDLSSIKLSLLGKANVVLPDPDIVWL